MIENRRLKIDLEGRRWINVFLPSIFKIYHLSSIIYRQKKMISTDYKGTTLHTGQMLKVRSNITEGTKSRIQSYEGMLIALRGRAENRMMVVRRIGPGGIGVERSWPINSTSIVDITVVREPKKVRRSKLYFLREVQGKAASRI